MTSIDSKMASVARLVEIFNFQVPGKRWHLFEFCDLSLYVPITLINCRQDIITDTSPESRASSNLAVKTP